MEGEVLVRHAFDVGRAALYASLDDPVEPGLIASLRALIERRVSHEPLAYVVGRREFYGLNLEVTYDVLVPRQETELLVDTALEFLGSRSGETLSVADVGTGAGGIALAIATHSPSATVYGTDISCRALRVAAVNRGRHNLGERLCLLHGDLMNGLPEAVDLIVCNPPYISSGEIPMLEPEVRQEPRAALDGGIDGLGVIRRLLCEALRFLRPCGGLLVEIDPRQLEATTVMARHSFPHADVGNALDFSRRPRVVTVRTGTRF